MIINKSELLCRFGACVKGQDISITYTIKGFRLEFKATKES